VPGAARRHRAIAFFALAQLPIQPALIDGYLDGGAQLTILNRLDQIAVRLRHLRPLQERVVQVSCQINHGDAQLGADLPASLYTIHLPGQLNVHQHQLRLHLGDLPNRVLPGSDHGRDGVAQFDQNALQSGGDDAVVFGNQDILIRHYESP
jgi:hypothetical protein